MTRVERWPHPYDPMLCIAIARLDAQRYRVVLGAHNEIAQRRDIEAYQQAAGLRLAKKSLVKA